MIERTSLGLRSISAEGRGFHHSDFVRPRGGQSRGPCAPSWPPGARQISDGAEAIFVENYASILGLPPAGWRQMPDYRTSSADVAGARLKNRRLCEARAAVSRRRRAAGFRQHACFPPRSQWSAASSWSTPHRRYRAHPAVEWSGGGARSGRARKRSVKVVISLP